MENSEVTQVPGHLYGPRRPSIGFWLGDNFIGEVLEHPANIEAARRKLGAELYFLQPSRNWAGYLKRSTPRVYC